MILNYIWIAFFLIAFLTALLRTLFWGEMEVFNLMLQSTFESSKTGFELSLYLTGVMAFWLGMMKIAEKNGIIEKLSWLIAPLFSQLFPTLSKNSPAMGAMVMNLAANMLGLDNAATPLGLKAMKELQAENPKPQEASEAQIMFLTLNTSGLTLIPVSIMVYRAQLGAANPADVFLPILIATFFSTFAGIVIVSLFQKINLFSPILLLYLGGISLLVALIIYGVLNVEKSEIERLTAAISGFILCAVMVYFVTVAAFKKNNAYELFIEGAKEGFHVAIGIVPYLIAILVGIGLFRASGAMDLLFSTLRTLVAYTSDYFHLKMDLSFIEALPVALMKPLSGSGARGLMVDLMKTHGADSLIGRMACILQGSTETTFYVLAVYFGSVGIRNTRYAVLCGLFADLVGVIAAIWVAYLFF
ncbi:nucleoside recognition domain-containing protein [Hugenholtzia roseola]|uniref:nucleoside recognition domain-containing protein n=1 Tax=Hugenholtzia roseola TaxID=1002 RepID=UPI000418C9BE|nr:spore maturation protein [Hugenholtzia roseola]